MGTEWFRSPKTRGGDRAEVLMFASRVLSVSFMIVYFGLAAVAVASKI